MWRDITVCSLWESGVIQLLVKLGRGKLIGLGVLGQLRNGLAYVGQLVEAEQGRQGRQRGVGPLPAFQAGRFGP